MALHAIKSLKPSYAFIQVWEIKCMFLGHCYSFFYKSDFVVPIANRYSSDSVVQSYVCTYFILVECVSSLLNVPVFKWSFKTLTDWIHWRFDLVYYFCIIKLLLIFVHQWEFDGLSRQCTFAITSTGICRQLYDAYGQKPWTSIQPMTSFDTKWTTSFMSWLSLDNFLSIGYFVRCIVWWIDVNMRWYEVASWFSIQCIICYNSAKLFIELTNLVLFYLAVRSYKVQTLIGTGHWSRSIHHFSW